MNHTTAVAAVVCVLLAGVAGTSAVVGTEGAGSHEDTPGGQPHVDRTITVTGHGSAEAAPDRAVLDFAVVAEGNDSDAVREELAADADALRRALEESGVDVEDVETTEFRIRDLRRDRYPGMEADNATYLGVHAFRVTLADVDRTGAVADAAAGAGAEVRGVSFAASDDLRIDLREEALTDAMDDADRQAETLAAAGDLQVTGVRHVDASDRQFVFAGADEAATEATADEETVFEPGNATVDVNVRVTYGAED